jgi:hypothetical protein
MIDPILFEIVAYIAGAAAIGSAVGVAIFFGVAAGIRALWRLLK